MRAIRFVVNYIFGIISGVVILLAIAFAPIWMPFHREYKCKLKELSEKFIWDD